MPAATDIPKSVEIQKHLTSVHIDTWLKEDVFQIRWWILIFLVIASLIIWLILLDKSKRKGVCLFAALAFIIVLAINEYGEELALWDYPTDIIPIFPPLTSINLLILPLIYSLAYQYFETKKRFIWAALIMTTVVCFVIEPLLSWGGIYQLLHWQYFYSFPLFFFMALLVRYLTIKIDRITEKSRHAV
ncbi:MAG: CBO0543 family protein [Bacillota bacterium]